MNHMILIALPLGALGWAAVPQQSNIVPVLVIGCVAAIILLWLLGKAFGRRQPAPPQTEWQAPPARPQPTYGPTPPSRPVPPQPGYGPAPTPTYGPPPGYAPPPAPGYPVGGGYGGPPPQQGGGGGGFVSGMLGGLGGAIAGNVLYDKFGRPHPEQGGPVHAPTHEGVTPSAPVGGDVQPPHEAYRPQRSGHRRLGWRRRPHRIRPPTKGEMWIRGVGRLGRWRCGDWRRYRCRGDWGGNENADATQLADAGTTGDWGTGASEEQAADAGTADWGGSDQGGGEADWGSEEPSGGSDDQGGSW